MQLTMQKFDGREGVNFTDVLDETGLCVGSCSQYLGHKTIKLFGERYVGEFQTFEECEAFIAGVVAVLNEAASTRIKRPFEASWSDHLRVEEKAS